MRNLDSDSQIPSVVLLFKTIFKSLIIVKFVTTFLIKFANRDRIRSSQFT